VSPSLCTAKQPPSPCTWLSHAQSTMEWSDYLCAFDAFLPFQLVSVYLRECPFLLVPFPVGHLTITARIVYSHISAMCLYTRSTKVLPIVAFRPNPFDTMLLPTIRDIRKTVHHLPLRGEPCCLPALKHCRPFRRRRFRDLEHSLPLRPGIFQPLASSNLLPP
jgi:hypothetical protein